MFQACTTLTSLILGGCYKLIGKGRETSHPHTHLTHIQKLALHLSARLTETLPRSLHTGDTTAVIKKCTDLTSLNYYECRKLTGKVKENSDLQTTLPRIISRCQTDCSVFLSRPIIPPLRCVVPGCSLTQQPPWPKPFKRKFDGKAGLAEWAGSDPRKGSANPLPWLQKRDLHLYVQVKAGKPLPDANPKVLPGTYDSNQFLLRSREIRTSFTLSMHFTLPCADV